MSYSIIQSYIIFNLILITSLITQDSGLISQN